MVLRRWLFAMGLLLIGHLSFAQVEADGQKAQDAEQLGKALDYFASKKYHESLLILRKLDEVYRLNPRYKAYLGVCYYYDWDYANAAKCLGDALPQLSNFAPHERSFYYWAAAESHFYLQEYLAAIPLYEAMLNLCYDNEKPDAYYRLGFCYLFTDDAPRARSFYQQALDAYLKFRNTPEEQARIVQISNMLKGLGGEAGSSHVGIDKGKGQ